MNRQNRYRSRRIWVRLLDVLVTLLIVLWCIVPVYWVFSTSFKQQGQEYAIPPEIWPSQPSLQAYRVVLGMAGSGATLLSRGSGMSDTEIANLLSFLVPIRNSLIVSTSVTAVSLLLAALAAYAISRLRFRWRIQSLMLLWMGGLIPAMMVILPTFVLLRSMHQLRTLTAMILPNIAYCIPLETWLLAIYFSSLPWELEDAAKVDGHKPIQIFWRVIMPLAGPGLFSAGVFAFLGSMGEFILASVVTMGNEQVATIPISILNFSYGYRYQWTWISAAIMLTVALMVFIALVFQRWVVQGLTAGAVKY